MKFTQSIIRYTAILLMTTLVVTSASAQEVSSQETTPTGSKDEYSSEKDILKSLLKPADTSSPRATLRSFLTNINFAIGLWVRDGELKSPEGQRAFVLALSTFDFSTTPDRDSEIIMTQRLLMLKEILDRIELPPYSQIPGDDEVAQGGLNRWTIPGSNITIQRVENGPRAGEFLFSARTVQRLHRYYRRVKHLPYKPDATPRIYEAYLTSKTTSAYFERELRNRLKPIDTSSPRSTLEGFLDGVNRAYKLVMEADAALKASPPKITRGEARETEIIAQNLMARAVATLDLSQVPEAIRADVGIESVLQLKEIFDRMVLPAIESVPDAVMVKAERNRLNSEGAKDRPVRWRYPNTTIEIVEIMEGARQGQFLFGANTVKHLSGFYEEVRDLPYRQSHATLVSEFMSPDKSEGFYDYYISTPGSLIPHASLLGGLVESLPNWFKTVHGGQTVWQWIFLALGFFLVILFLVTLHGRVLRRPVELSHANRDWRRVLFYLVAAGTVVFLYHLLDEYVNLTGSALYVSGTILQTIFWLSLSTATFHFGGAIAETIVASPKIDPEGIQASYIRALCGLVGFLAAAAIFITGLSRVGVSLVPILTGVGIGGLAIALAARPTIENIIGSFMIFLDKPYRVGQRVNVMGHSGTVESIGLRSTKIRLLTGHLTSIPNEKMAAADIENIGRRPHIRRLTNITITYDTPPEKIVRAVEILREILSVPEAVDPKTTVSTGELVNTAAAQGEAEPKPHPNEVINHPDFPPWVYFNELNADSLNILVIYWYHPAQYKDYLEHATWINLQIMERFNAEGIDFAFPTQTLHMAGDEKRPLNVGVSDLPPPSHTTPTKAELPISAAITPQLDDRPDPVKSEDVAPVVKEEIKKGGVVEGEDS